MPATGHELARRAFLMALAAPLLADTRQEILDLITELASALSEGNGLAFLDHIDHAMPDYQKLEQNILALTEQNEVSAAIDILKQEEAIVTPELQQLAAMHVYDLLAIAIGPQRDARHVAGRRGLRAAHLGAIKKEIADRAGGKLSIEMVAARHRLSPRHVQRLFEQHGTSFTEYLREQRLLRAHRMLVSPRFAHLRISDIAFEAGFSDLSWFNRLFRRRFGMAPADIRIGPTDQT